MTLTHRIREFIKDHLKILENDVIIKDDDNIFELGFVDSLFALQLINFIEEEFNIELENKDLNISNFSTVNSIVNVIKNKKNF